MAYLIDGHNLIPHLPGLSLQAEDDEMQLVMRLQEFCRRRQKNVEVYFDKAPPGQDRTLKMGRVSARFVPESTTADRAIRSRLKRLGKEAHNWTVVSSDLAVQSTARWAGARVISSQDFATLMTRVGKDASEEPERGDRALSQEEIDAWMKIFSAGKKQSK
jgi:predicted RNA-binding protein with PIN domain